MKKIYISLALTFCAASLIAMEEKYSPQSQSMDIQNA